MPESVPPRSRALRVVLPLAALFLLPVLGAHLLFFYFPDWQPQGRTNYGELVTPARPAPAFAAPLKERWSFVYVTAGACEAVCADKLSQVRQIRLALNEKRTRVQYALIAATAPDAALRAEHPDLMVLPASAETQAFFGEVAPGSLLLLDPLGNWLMRYPATAESRGIYNDIKKLLKLSNIG